MVELWARTGRWSWTLRLSARLALRLRRSLSLIWKPGPAILSRRLTLGLTLSLRRRLTLGLTLMLRRKLTLRLTLILRRRQTLRLTLILRRRLTLRSALILALGRGLRGALRGHPDRKRRRRVLWTFAGRRPEHILESGEALFRGATDASGMLMLRRPGHTRLRLSPRLDRSWVRAHVEEACPLPGRGGKL